MGFIADGFARVQKNKTQFVLLVGLQFLVLLLLFGGMFHFQVKMLEAVQGIVDPLAEANFDVAALQDGATFLEDVEGIEVHFENLKKQFWYMVAWVLVVLLSANWFLWKKCHSFVGRKVNDWKKYAGGVGIAAVVVGVIGSLLAKKIFSNVMSTTVPSEAYWLGFVCLIGMYFFMCVAGIMGKPWDRLLGVLKKSVAVFLGLMLFEGIIVYFLVESVSIAVWLAVVFAFLLLIVITLVKVMWLSFLKNESDY